MEELVEVRIVISEGAQALYINGRQVVCETELDLNVVLEILAEEIPPLKLQWIEDYDEDTHLRR